MSFSTSSRFSEYIVCSPAPTAYNIPSTFDENVTNDFSAWAKPWLFPGHKCDNTCSSTICARNIKGLNASFLKKPPCSRRCSLDPGILKFSNNDNLSGDITNDKDQQALKPKLSFQGFENKENFEKKNSSNIPRFKKQVTEGQAPSFLTRPQLRHNCCFPKIDEDEDGSATATTSAGQFNRHSVTRKSIKPIRKNEQYSEDSVIKKAGEQILRKSCDPKGIEAKEPGAVTKGVNNVSDKVKKAGNNLNVTESLSKILLKDRVLTEELSSESKSKQYYDITSTSSREESNRKSEITKMRSYNLSALDDCKVLFLVNEEFIDDEYDSYIKEWSGARAYLQVLQNQELYEMAKYLVHVYLEGRDPTGKFTKAPVRRRVQNKRKNNKYIWNKIESIVRASIAQLEREFRTRIYEKTNEKLDELITDLKSVVLKANENIEDTCERTAENLISRLENAALKL